MRGVRQEDFFPLVFLVPAAIIFPLVGRSGNWELFNLQFFAFMSLAFIGLALATGCLRAKEGRVMATAGRAMRDFLPLAILALVYANIGFLQADYVLDSRIVALNQRHLGFQDFELLSSFGGTLAADFFSLVYFAYIPLGFGFGIAVYDVRDNRAFRSYVAPMLLTHYFAFLFFVFVPVQGPKYYLASEYPAHLHGDIVGPLNAWLFESIRSNTTDCMPSMHTALFVHMALAAWGWRRKWFPFIALMTILTMVSCVYLWYHYGVDVILGALLPLFTWFIVTTLEPGLGGPSR